MQATVSAMARSALAMVLAAAITLAGIGGAAALPDVLDPDNPPPSPCHLTMPDGKKVWFSHGQIIRTADGKKYQCNDGKWQEVRTFVRGNGIRLYLHSQVILTDIESSTSGGLTHTAQFSTVSALR